MADGIASSYKAREEQFRYAYTGRPAQSNRASRISAASWLSVTKTTPYVFESHSRFSGFMMDGPPALFPKSLEQ